MRSSRVVAVVLMAYLCAASGFVFPAWMHKTDDIWAAQRDMATRCGGIMTMSDFKDTGGDHSASLPVITFSKPGNTPKTKVFFTFNIHARELISGEIGLNLVKTICGETSGKSSADPAVNFPDNVELKMIPVLNPNGRKIVEAGNECQRKNGDNVDINRNFDVDFDGENKEKAGNSEEFEGNKAFSEPEARIARDVAKGFGPNIKLYIDIHSGANTMMYPWAYKQDSPPAADVARWEAFANVIKADVNPRIGEASHTIGYTATGVTMDYFYNGSGGDVSGKAPNSYTFETYDSGAFEESEMSASGAVELLEEEEGDSDCFRIFNPQSQDALTDQVGKWTTVLMNAIAKAPVIDTMGQAVPVPPIPQPAVAPADAAAASAANPRPEVAGNAQMTEPPVNGDEDEDEDDEDDDEGPNGGKEDDTNGTEEDGEEDEEDDEDDEDDDDEDVQPRTSKADVDKLFSKESASMVEEMPEPATKVKASAAAAAMQDDMGGSDGTDVAEVPTVSPQTNSAKDDSDDITDDASDDSDSDSPGSPDDGSDSDSASDTSDDADSDQGAGDSGDSDDDSLLEEEESDSASTDDTYRSATRPTLRGKLGRL